MDDDGTLHLELYPSFEYHLTVSEILKYSMLEALVNDVNFSSVSSSLEGQNAALCT